MRAPARLTRGQGGPRRKCRNKVAHHYYNHGNLVWKGRSGAARTVIKAPKSGQSAAVSSNYEDAFSWCGKELTLLSSSCCAHCRPFALIIFFSFEIQFHPLFCFLAIALRRVSIWHTRRHSLITSPFSVALVPFSYRLAPLVPLISR